MAAAKEGHTAVLDALLPSSDTSMKDEDGATALYLAAANGHTLCVNSLLRANVAIEARSAYGLTPLHAAILGQHADAAINLLTAGASYSSEIDLDGTSWPPLPQAALMGDLKLVEILINAGADVNQANSVGKTSLLIAAWNGHDSLIEFLLAAGASVEGMTRDNVGYTALMACCARGSLEILQLLLDAGAVLDARNRYGAQAIHFASEEGHGSTIRELCRRGANPDAPTIRPRVQAVSERVLGSDYEDDSLKISSSDEDDDFLFIFAPLHLAALRNRTDAIAAPLENGAMVDVRNDDQSTPLTIAAVFNDLTVVEQLLNHGCEINAHDRLGYTALHYSVENGQSSMCSRLLSGGADVSVVCDEGWLPIHLAVLNGNSEIVSQLLLAGSPVNQLLPDGVTALLLAADHGHYEIVEILLDKGASTSLEICHPEHVTPLWAASRGGYENVVRHLITAGADLEARRDEDDATSLHLATPKNYPKVVEILVKAGANISARTKDGDSALHLAALEGNELIVRTLSKPGPTITRGNRFENSPLHVASRKGNFETVKILLASGRMLPPRTSATRHHCILPQSRDIFRSCPCSWINMQMRMRRRSSG